MKIRLAAVAASLLCAVAAVPANAATLTQDGGWSSFSFGGVGSSINPSFDFTVVGKATLKITDAFLDGDRFEVFLNGVSQGQTSAPANDGTSAGGDYDAAFASPLFSHGSYLLSAGNYTLTAVVTESPYGGGGGAAKLISAAGVPEPATWALMILGFGAVGGAMRRRQSVAAKVRFA